MKPLPWLSCTRVSVSYLRSSLALLATVLGCLCPATLPAQTVTFTGKTPAVDFGEANVCRPGDQNPSPCSLTMTLSYKVTASGTLGATRVVTQGDTNLDFTLASGSTCAGSVIQGNTCIVKVKFAPKFPGWRPGAVLLTDAAGSVLAKTFVNGYGTGPQIGFASTTTVPIPFTGLELGSSPAFCDNYTVDGAGNIFALCLNPTNNPFPGVTIVVEVPADGGPQVTLPFNGLLEGEGLALDGAGDLFVLDVSNSDVLELPAGGGAQVSIPVNAPGNGNNLNGLAVDGKGDVFIGNTESGGVYELPAGGSQITVPFTGLTGPGSVAVDYFGDIFTASITATDANGAVVELPAGQPPQKILFSAAPGTLIGWSGGLTADSSGDLFFTYDVGEGESWGILELPAGKSTPVNLGVNVSNTGLFVSPSGNIFFLSDAPEEVQRSQSAPLNFGSIPVGSTKTLPLGITNTGNRTLVLSPYFKSPSYKISESPADCMKSIAPDAVCTLNVQFTALSVGDHTIALTLGGNVAADKVLLLQGIGTK